MKKAFMYILVFVTIGSMGYGYYQSTENAALKDDLDAALQRATVAEGEAHRQMKIASEHRVLAEMASRQALEAKQRAEQALAECTKRKR